MTDYLRVNDGWNELATVDLFNDSTGKAIGIVGCIHIGPVNYWARLQSVMSTFAKGYTVHYEKVELEDGDRVTLGIILKVMLFSGVSKKLKKIAESIGWSYQTDSLFYRPEWERHDTSVIKSLEAMTLGQAFKIRLIAGLTGPIIKYTIKHRPELLFQDGGIGSKGIGDSDESILRYRNEVSVKAALAAEGNVVMLWGVGHLPGQIELLEAQGYKVVNTSWMRHSRVSGVAK